MKPQMAVKALKVQICTRQEEERESMAFVNIPEAKQQLPPPWPCLPWHSRQVEKTLMETQRQREQEQ